MSPEQFDKWRIMPRVLMIAFYGFFMWAFIWVSSWFMAYDFTALTDSAVALAIAGFPTAILAVLTGVLANLTKLYLSTGGDHNGGNGG